MRNRSSSIARQISADVYHFDFYQAVRLLEAVHAQEQQHQGHQSKLWDSPIRFRTRVGLSFCRGQIAELNLSEEVGKPYEMVVNFFGLTGIDSPLPYFYTEEIINQESQYIGKSALREFFDLFNHRLLRLKFDIDALVGR